MKISFGSFDPPAACCFWLWLINNYTGSSCSTSGWINKRARLLCVAIFPHFSRPRRSRFQLIIDQSPFVSVLGTSKGFWTLELCVCFSLQQLVHTKALHFALPLLNKIADELNAGCCVALSCTLGALLLWVLLYKVKHTQKRRNHTENNVRQSKSSSLALLLYGTSLD